MLSWRNWFDYFLFLHTGLRYCAGLHIRRRPAIRCSAAAGCSPLNLNTPIYPASCLLKNQRFKLNVVWYEYSYFYYIMPRKQGMVTNLSVSGY